jgi:hypothetical protein
MFRTMQPTRGGEIPDTGHDRQGKILAQRAVASGM